MIFLFIIQFFIGISIQVDQIYTKRPIDCDQSQLFCYGNENNNQIRNYLKSLSNSTKDILLKEQIQHYALVKIEVKYTQSKGLGVFLLQDIQNKTPIWKQDSKKCIGSFNINYGMFFQNTLSLTHKKLQLKSDMPGLKIMFQYLYHFSMIEKSFLNFFLINQRGDLSNHPYHDICPFLHLTPFEVELFNNQFDIELYQSIINKEQSIKMQYKNFTQTLQHQFSDEQLSLLFQRDHISMQEYVLLYQYINTRAHRVMIKSKKQSYILPIVNYVNCYDELHHQNRVSYLSKRKIFYNNLGSFLQGQEYFNYYGYEKIQTYALFSGFVPKTFDIKIKLIDDQITEKFKLSKEISLLKDKFQIYLNQFQNGIKNNNEQNNSDFDLCFKLLNPMMLQKQIDHLKQMIKKMKEYINYRKYHNFNTNHIQTFLNYFELIYSYIVDKPEMMIKSCQLFQQT